MSDKEYEAALARAHKLGVEEGLKLVFDKYGLDAIVAPAWTQMSIYAAWSGGSLTSKYLWPITKLSQDPQQQQSRWASIRTKSHMAWVLLAVDLVTNSYCRS